MLRHFYRCALRLHPPAFRTRFAGEMLSIFDHAGGRAAEFRLMLDALLSLARQWALRPEFWHELSPVPAQQPTPDGIPSFYIIDPFRPRAAAVIHGLVLSTAVFCMTCFAIRYSWIHILHVRIPEVQRDEPQSTSRIAGSAADATSKNPDTSPRSEDRTPPAPSAGPLSPFSTQLHAARTATANQNLSAQSPATLSPQTQASETLGSKSHKGPKRLPGVVRREPVPQMPLQSSAGAYLDQPQAQPPTLQNATGVTSRAAVAGVALDAPERKRVIDGAVANLNKYYVDPEVARKMGDALIAHEKAGDDDAAADGAAFANLLTSQMMDVSHDQYVMMVYSAVTAPENPPAPTREDVTRYRREMKERNCTFEKVTILPHNIAYLKFNGFPDASICRETVTAAMASVSHADAIIFDLRDNPGGYSNMVALIATYLFDHRTHLNDFYDRGENSTEQSWTLPPVPGNRLADKPAFVLTSHSTFSAAEGFSYDLKMLKRATLVGETTSGRGHMGIGHQIDDHFTIRVPGIRVINPISKTNWEGTGVEPDVQVQAADALEAARKLAETQLQKK